MDPLDNTHLCSAGKILEVTAFGFCQNMERNIFSRKPTVTQPGVIPHLQRVTTLVIYAQVCVRYMLLLILTS